MSTYLIKETDDYEVTRNEDTGALNFHIVLDKDDSEKHTECVNLANKISHLPDEELKAFAYTPGLEKEWEYERSFSGDVGFCFLAKEFEFDEKLVRKIITDEFMLSLIEAIVGRYQVIRALVKAGFPVLKKYFSECPENSEDLLYQIIREERNQSFESKLTYDFVQYEPSKLAKFHTELAKKNADAIDQAKLERLKPIHLRANNSGPSLFTRVTDCLSNNVDRTPPHLRAKINHNYNLYNETHRYLDEILASGYSGRSNKGNFIPTVTYDKGVISCTSYGRK